MVRTRRRNEISSFLGSSRPASTERGLQPCRKIRSETPTEIHWSVIFSHYHTIDDQNHYLHCKSLTDFKKRALIVYKDSGQDEKEMRLNLRENSLDAIYDLIQNNEIQSIPSSMNSEFNALRSPRVEATIPPMAKIDEKIDRMRQNLPVYNYRSEIMDAINGNRIVVICGETGNLFTFNSLIEFLDQCMALNFQVRERLRKFHSLSLKNLQKNNKSAEFS